ncbi:ATPase [Staphylococcus aureus]
MTQFLGALLLTGVLGYIPYKYLTMIGLVSEKNKIINTPVLLTFSIETCLIWFYCFIFFNSNVDLKNLNLLQLFTGLKANIWFLFIFVLTVLVINPLIVKFIIWLINKTRKCMNLDCISLLDKRDKLFNNNGKPVFIVIKDFENRIIEEGELKTYNSAGSDFDLLEVERQDFKVSDLPSNDELYIKHTLVDLKQQIKLDLYLMNEY